MMLMMALFAGPHIPKQINLESIVEMMSYFVETNGVIHYKYAHRIVNEAKAILERCTTVVDIQIPAEGRLTIVGDIHGQLEDLLTIFKLNGM
jgi:serine/threonine-protein phosphatase 5